MSGEGSTVERYELLGELATGGMATVYFGRQRGAFGFTRTVAIKSMHPQLAKDPAFRAMFIDEANLTARIRHPNVVPTLDIVSSPTKLLIVMEYVEGVSLSVLLRAARATGKKLPIPVVAAIMRDLLDGLHAAHELVDDRGDKLNVVHRDISPQNLLVGVDGLARVVDFGVAKAAGRNYHTQTGEIRGKVGYMAPEQMFGEDIDRRVDLYAAGVVFWEALVGERLFNAPTDAALVLLVMKGSVTAPSTARGERMPSGLDALICESLSHEPGQRPPTAADMMQRLLALVTPASREEVGAWVRELAPDEMSLRASYLRQSSPGLASGDLEPEAKAILEVLTRATMSRDTLGTGEPVPATGPRRILPVAITIALLVAASAISSVTLIKRSQAERAAAAPKPTTSATAGAAGAGTNGGSAPAESSSALTTADPVPNPSNPDGAGNAGPTGGGDLSGGPGKQSGRHNPTTWGGRGSRGPKTAGTGQSGQSATGNTPPPPPPPPKPDCNPPFTTDEEGHRHYKAECLK